MPRQTKVELYASIRRDARAGMSGRALQTKYGVGWRTVQAATNAAWPNARRKYPTRGSKLDPFKPFIDEVLRADLRAPRKQRHTIIETGTDSYRLARTTQAKAAAAVG